MTKKTAVVEVKKKKRRAYELPSADVLKDGLNVGDVDLVTQKINEITQLLWFYQDASDATKHTRIVRAVELYESLEPADGSEGMLAMQMVGTHDAALECLRRAALSNQTFAGRDMSLKHAHKLMTLYTQQLAALNKHRGKGQQKVTVEHVNVQAGGQAIVGNVDASAARRMKPDQGQEAIENQVQPPLEPAKAAKPVRSKKRKE
jgi:phosphatidate phosphatase PAH1